MYVRQHRVIPRWNEWVPLASQSLRLRKLVKILAMNIGTEDLTGEMCRKTCDCKNAFSPLFYYTLHATAFSAPFYTSEKLESTCPKWKEIDYGTWGKSGVFSGTEAFVLRLWCHNPPDEMDEVITVWGVNLSGLMLLGQQLTVEPHSVKPNTIIFLLPGGYYTHPNYITSAENRRYLSVYAAKEDVRLSYTSQMLSRLQTLQRKILLRSRESGVLKEKISSGVYATSDNRGSATLRKLLNRTNSKSNHLAVEKLKKCVELERFRVQTLKEERVRLQGKVKASRDRLEALCDRNQYVESQTMEKYRLLQREVTAHREWLKNHVEQREAQIHARAVLNFRIKQLVSELNYIYPVSEDGDKLSICGVYLPDSENFAGCDELQLSVALGFVAHSVQMISIFLQIPLRYPIVHFGSRTRIIDHVADKIPDNERDFPLFCKGQDKLQFNYAVYLLNKNIAQLRCGCGLPTHDLRCTLANLSSLFRIGVADSHPESSLRSPSSSTLDLPSSFSISSPIEGISSPAMFNVYPRTQRVSEPAIVTVKNDSIIPVGHRITKSAGSAKDFQLQPIPMPPMDDHLKVVPLATNLSYSLDKGLDEFKEISRIEEAENMEPAVPFHLGGSDTSLPACLSRRNSTRDPSNLAEEAAPSDYLKNWDSQKIDGLFSENESDLDDSVVLIEKAMTCYNHNPVSNSDLSQQVKEEVLDVDQISVGTEVCDDMEHCDNSLQRVSPSSDALLASVTNRTEVLASNSSSFNMFRSKFRTT